MPTQQNALRRQIAEKRDEIGDDLLLLERQIRNKTDWRR